MSIGYRYLAALILIAGLLFVGWDYSRLRTKLHVAEEAAKTAQAALQKQKATQVFRDRVRVLHADLAASEVQRLDKALDLNKDWASQPVPQEVQDAINSH